MCPTCENPACSATSSAQRSTALPSTSTLRPQFLRWQIYLATTLYMSDLRYFYPERYTADAAGSAAVKARAEEMMMHEFGIYAEALGSKPYVLGDTMCAADIYAAMLCTWAPDMKVLFAKHTNLGAMYDRVLSVPAIKAVWDRNGA